MVTTSLWRFGPFCLDPASGCLWREEALVPLRPKPLALLAYLVAHAGAVVTKATLFEAVWPEAVVSEGVLKDYINQIRKTLGDTPHRPQYIATVHRRGYRFVAPVTTLWRSPAEAAVQMPPVAVVAAALGAQSAAVRSPGLVVAREVELAQLQQWWALAQQGHRQLGLISGEAGIGKTTLVDAFVAQVTAEQTVGVGYGQCIEQYGVGEAYLPLLEAFGRLGRAGPACTARSACGWRRAMGPTPGTSRPNSPCILCRGGRPHARCSISGGRARMLCSGMPIRKR